MGAGEFFDRAEDVFHVFFQFHRDYVDGFYCSDYCCYGVLNWLYSTQNTDIRECCSSALRQVPSYYRDDLCLSSWIIDYMYILTHNANMTHMLIFVNPFNLIGLYLFRL